jgi:hypothetical protein
MKPRNSKLLPIAVTCALIGMTPAMAATTGTHPSSAQDHGKVITRSAHYSKPVRRLLEAAQRLRDATHAMAAENPGTRRSQVIRQADKALLDTQEAMMDLPSNLLKESKAAPIVDSNAMNRLQVAAQRLRDAAHAMADQPASADRSATIRQIDEALLDTKRAMIDLVPRVTANSMPSHSAATTGQTSSK